jgi:hypothetical protein
MAISRDKDIFRLEIAVNDTSVVGRGQALGDLYTDINCLVHAHRAVAQTLT